MNYNKGDEGLTYIGAKNPDVVDVLRNVNIIN